MKSFIKKGGYSSSANASATAAENYGYINLLSTRGRRFIYNQNENFKKLDNSGKIKVYLIIVIILFFIAWFIYYLITNSTRKLSSSIYNLW